MNQRSIGYLEPFAGESISHYLGRYRRQPVTSVSSPLSFGLQTGCGSIFYRWEKLYFNPRPTAEEIELVCSVIGLTKDELVKLLPTTNESVLIQPIRLCAACYSKDPWHLMKWQYKSQFRCDCNELQLLSSCSACHQSFPSPVSWQKNMRCQRCGFAFRKMHRKQT